MGDIGGLTGGAALCILVIREVLTFLGKKNGGAPATASDVNTTNILLQSILNRITNLESDVRYVLTGKPPTGQHAILTQQGSQSPQ